MISKFSKTLAAVGLILIITLFPLEAKAVAPLVIAGILGIIPLFIGLLTGIFSIGVFITVAGAVNLLGGTLIDWGIRFQSIILEPEKIAVIQASWKMLRDFANIFFILILLIIAFSTIFNKPTGYTAKDLLPKLIIAALLINFSLIITIEVINLLWVPAAVFLNPLGQDISGKIANALTIQDFFSVANLKLLLTNLLEGGLPVPILFREGFIRGIILVINAFILSWIALIMWARIPVLLGLMIVSPLAWLGYTLPVIRKGSWGAWWQKLFCWGSIPIPLFGLIYFVVFFNQRLKLEINQIALSSYLATRIPVLEYTVGQTLVWIITVGLFLGGLTYVRGLSCSMYGWMSKAAWGTWGGVRRGVGRAVDFGYTATGYKGAVGRLQEDVKKMGFFGGAAIGAREARREDQLRGLFGLRPTFTTQRDTLDKAEKETRDIENRFKQAKSTTEETVIIDELRAIVAGGAKDPETLAAINALAKKGQLDATLFNRAVENFKDTPLALTKVFSEWKEGKFGGVRADELIQILGDARTPLEAKRIGYNFIASDDGKKVAEQIKTADEWAKMYEVLGGRMTKSGREAKKFMGEINPLVVAEYSIKPENLAKEFDKPEDYPKDLTNAVLKQIERTDSRNFTKYSKEAWKKDEFKKALIKVLVNKQKKDPRTAAKFAQETRKWLIRENKDDELEIFNQATAATGVEYLS